MSANRLPTTELHYVRLVHDRLTDLVRRVEYDLPGTTKYCELQGALIAARRALLAGLAVEDLKAVHHAY